ncbi:MAG: hydrogenase maturation protease, partial [Actinomycetota bacterium]|nr:hydrogenase maturation protease [Actinomycetota bacterium]
SGGGGGGQPRGAPAAPNTAGEQHLAPPPGPFAVFDEEEATGPSPAPVRRTSARVLVGGIGLPWLRDLDFGTQFIRRVEGLEWPDDVVVEDLSYAAHRVLHRLKELQPEKVVLVGAMPRDVDPPGTIRRYILDLTPPDDKEVADRLSEAIGGIIDLDHTLAVVRYWKGFPAGTVVIEVEPNDRAFGLGFSPEVEAKVDEVLAMIRAEVGMVTGADLVEETS